jgi:hypothetical protein
MKFLEKIKKDNIYDKLKKEEIKSIHKNFYNEVKYKIKNEFYKNSEGPLKIFKYNK